ncbi:YbaB/EbfC family nucleoid-associated protein [Capnocytophaga sp. oral taxon 878]|uniref:YbaB/EbfC family nucleoid-associated protein n=1 Tax=Capnocytophaga sp. oral taxon 878 TaxID=1316596 RepID=UPI000D02364E|nr:YbaB/EbfC family nucleoid-associated protein [Capnocytophaga sp. oral taxon 878]AVM50118.1 nucleoid-associated protein, YbaB/EbfC family [Capnocytophaga sp. oral taxon 878]
MFGNMMDMMGRLQEIKQKTDEAKAQLNSVLLEETSADGNVKVTINANREIKSISIDDTLLEDKEALEDFLILTLNKAIARATEKNEAALAEVAKQGLPFNF